MFNKTILDKILDKMVDLNTCKTMYSDDTNTSYNQLKSCREEEKNTRRLFNELREEYDWYYYAMLVALMIVVSLLLYMIVIYFSK
jgi:hypothetical protein